MPTGTELGMLGLQGLQGLFGGIGQSQATNQNKRDTAQARLDAILQQLMQFEQGKLDRSRQDAASFANAQGPLGQEQAYVQRNNILRSLLPGMASAQAPRPLDPAIAALTPQTSNPLAGLLGTGGGLRPDIAQSFSDDATSRALTDRRKALAALNPDFVFQPLSDYMGSNPNSDIFNAEVSDAGKLVRDQRTAGYGEIGNILNSQRSGAEQQLQDASKGGGSWWKSLLGPLAGIGASFIPGVGPLLSGLIGAGVGGASDGVRGAILGGGTGASTDWLRGQLGGGNPTQLNNQLGQAAPTFPGLGLGGSPGGNSLNLPSSPTASGFAPFAGGVSANSPGMPSGGTRMASSGFSPSSPSQGGINIQDLLLAGGGGAFQPPNVNFQPGAIPPPSGGSGLNLGDNIRYGMMPLPPQLVGFRGFGINPLPTAPPPAPAPPPPAPSIPNAVAGRPISPPAAPQLGRPGPAQNPIPASRPPYAVPAGARPGGGPSSIPASKPPFQGPPFEATNPIAQLIASMPDGPARQALLRKLGGL